MQKKMASLEGMTDEQNYEMIKKMLITLPVSEYRWSITASYWTRVNIALLLPEDVFANVA